MIMEFSKKDLMAALDKEIAFAYKMLAEYEDTALTTMTEYYKQQARMWTEMKAYMGKRIPADKGGPA